MNDKIRKLSKQLLDECQKQGISATIGVADRDTGESIRQMSGNLGDVLLLIALLFLGIEQETGFNATKLAKENVKAVRINRKIYMEDIENGD